MLAGLPRYIATVETAKHRVFQFLEAAILPDNKIVCAAVADAFHLGVLSSRIHLVWALRAGGWLGMGNDPVYVKSRVFDPFPFPDASPALKARIRAEAEELDALRKTVQREHPGLTLTQIYNVLEKLRAKTPLDAEEEEIKANGLVLIVRERHDALDALAAQAYGWPAGASEETILANLVALNRARAAEEARGEVRWLRPDYQMERAGLADRQAAAEAEAQLSVPLDVVDEARKPAFPANATERTEAVRAVLAAARAPLMAAEFAAAFRQGEKAEKPIAQILAAMQRFGSVHAVPGGGFMLRRA